MKHHTYINFIKLRSKFLSSAIFGSKNKVHFWITYEILYAIDEIKVSDISSYMLAIVLLIYIV